MAGTLKVGGVPLATHSDSTAKVSLDSGLTFPAGHIVHVVQVVKTNTFTANVADWSQYITGLEPSIILKQNNSKVLIQTTQHWTSAYGGAEGGGIRLYRNGTEVAGTRDTSLSWSAWFSWNGDVGGPNSADAYAPGNYNASFLDNCFLYISC